MPTLKYLVFAAFVLGNFAADRGLHAADDDFIPLFNGKDLSGWVLTNTPSETWSFEDGVLKCTGKPIGEIRTERMYQNFVLELEWRHMVSGGNAGIFVWADDITARGVPFHRGVEVQVLENAYGQSQGHTTHGDIFPIHGATMTPINGRGGSRAFPTEERSRPSPEWNHYRIECNDGAISLAVNGKLVTQGKDASPRKGYICIESEGGVVQYRNVKIRELPETPVKPEQVAIANRGYRSLYNGLNLDGWNLDEEGKDNWQSKDWILAYDGKAETVSGKMLRSTERFGNYGFLLDIKPGEGFDGLGLPGGVLPTQYTKIGEWSRLEGVIENGLMKVSVNGTEVTMDNPVPDVASFNLYLIGPAELANIYVREIRN
jgi:hypothetical protein